MPKEYLNNLEIKRQAVGNERRIEMLNDMTSESTFIPKTVKYEDIDEAFRDWVESLELTSDNGKEFPTVTLYSNQRFTEYSQSWKFTDKNNNLLLNFKSITRENNPQYGNIQGGLWNIPGDRFYLMKQKRVLDDNGSESLLRLEMRQPVAIDLSYKVSIFTTMYKSINDFNTIINKAFSPRQCYIAPNGHFMPMNLESISDESQYNIDDRQFYSQTYDIKVLAYIITEEDYRVSEYPLKAGSMFGFPKMIRNKNDVELEEGLYVPVTIETKCGLETIYVKTESGKTVTNINEVVCPEKFFFMPITINVYFKGCYTAVNFTVDTDIVITGISLTSVGRDYTLKVNGEPVSKNDTITLKNGDEVRIKIYKKPGGGVPTISLLGYNPNVVYEDEAEYWNRIATEQEDEQYEDIDADE